MMRSQARFSLRPLRWGDALILAGITALLYVGIRLAFHTPATITGPTITLDPRALPYYSLRSLERMSAAYTLSILFTLIYGRVAAYHSHAEKILIPLLDVLQSVPILSFLPVVLLSLTVILPQGIAVELAAIVLIFTSQVWNLTFSWYQSLTTLPKELKEASQIFRFNGWLRFKTLELPFGTPGLVWNSMMSWAGGWFFLMAAEIFTVGDRDFRLPGLGAYLQEAANQGNLHAIFLGLTALILLIVLLDQFIWRPLIAWSERFTLEMTERNVTTSSWFYEAIRTSTVMDWIGRVLNAIGERFDAWTLQRWPFKAGKPETPPSMGQRMVWGGLGLLVLASIGYGALSAGWLLMRLPPGQWGAIGIALVATTLRVLIALLIALAWTVPVGVAIGMNPRLAAWLQPLVQMVASIPATALFPILVLALITLPGGVNLAAILLMLLGTQWYLLFNVIAGASTIPQDLRYTADLLQLSRWERWRTLILPALFPFLVTGGITASGGAWNASIVAEYVQFGGKTFTATGLGALISLATAHGDYPLLLASTLAMILAVIIINRIFWRRLYRLAEERYRLE